MIVVGVPFGLSGLLFGLCSALLPCCFDVLRCCYLDCSLRLLGSVAWGLCACVD